MSDPVPASESAVEAASAPPMVPGQLRLEFENVDFSKLRVSIDGKSVAVTGPKVLELPQGEHLLALQYRGQKFSRNVWLGTQPELVRFRGDETPPDTGKRDEERRADLVEGTPISSREQMNFGLTMLGLGLLAGTVGGLLLWSSNDEAWSCVTPECTPKEEEAADEATQAWLAGGVLAIAGTTGVVVGTFSIVLAPVRLATDKQARATPTFAPPGLGVLGTF